MFRYKIWLGLAVICVTFFVCVSYVQAGSVNTNPTTSNIKSPVPVIQPNAQPQVASTEATGASAIKVQVATGATTKNDPAFTKQDVIAFLNTHPFYSGLLVTGAQLKIVKIDFITAAQASAIMGGESVGRPDNYLVCYVQVEGPFLTTNMHMPPNTHPKKNTVEYGYVVFDAHTGNELVWGTWG